MKWNFWKCGFLRNEISQLMTHHLQINIDIITHDSAPPRHSLWYQCWFARDSSFVVKYHFSKTTFSEIVHFHLFTTTKKICEKKSSIYFCSIFSMSFITRGNNQRVANQNFLMAGGHSVLRFSHQIHTGN